jgi:hypothetical protein
VFIDELKLDFFDLHSLKRPRASTYVIQIGRIRKQLDRDAKKAAKLADKLRRRQQHVLAKEGKLPLQYFLIISLHLIYFHSRGSTQL